MTDYDLYDREPVAHDVLMRMQTDPSWAPAGGTSNGRFNELLRAYMAEFRVQFAARVAERGDLWLREFGSAAIYVGFIDDRYGGYFVNTGLQHHIHVPEDELRALCYLVYTLADDDDVIVRQDSGIGRRYFEPPHAHDVTLHIDHLLAALDAHRKLLAFEHDITENNTKQEPEQEPEHGGVRRTGRLYYTTYEQARAAGYYYAQGRQDQHATGYRQAGQIDRVVEIRDTDAAERFANRFAAAFQAYRDEIAGHGVNLESAYDNWLDHGHCYDSYECPTCGHFLNPADPSSEPTTEKAADHTAEREPVGSDRCSRCNARPQAH